MMTSSKFYAKYSNVLDKYDIREVFKYNIVMFDNVMIGMKNTNRVGHVTFNFRTQNVVRVEWAYTDLFLLNLIEEEFDSGYLVPEVPEYFEFNGKTYTVFSAELIEDMLKNTEVNNAKFVCTREIWEYKSF